jgi:hypothetical protein
VSGGQPEQMVLSAVVGCDVEPRTGSRLFAGHSSFGHGEALRILDRAEQFGFSRLSEARPGEDRERSKNGEGSMRGHVL